MTQKRESPVLSSASVNSGAQSTFGAPHLISVVIPVYGGERTLAGVVDGARAAHRSWHDAGRTPVPGRRGHPRVRQRLGRLARGHGQLAAQYPFVRPIWLSRNFGQHAATLAGMASSGGEWIVTLDEDGQHDPADIVTTARYRDARACVVVYARPTNKASHGFFRNSASKGAKWFLTKLFAGSNAADYQSYRLMLGNVGRSVAAYSGSNVVPRRRDGVGRRPHRDRRRSSCATRAIAAPATRRASFSHTSGGWCSRAAPVACDW